MEMSQGEIDSMIDNGEYFNFTFNVGRDRTTYDFWGVECINEVSRSEGLIIPTLTVSWGWFRDGLGWRNFTFNVGRDRTTYDFWGVECINEVSRSEGLIIPTLTVSRTIGSGLVGVTVDLQ